MAAPEFRLFERNLPDVETEEAAELVQTHFGLDGELHALDGERDLNFRVDGEDGSFVFKIANAEDGEDVVLHTEPPKDAHFLR